MKKTFTHVTAEHVNCSLEIIRSNQIGGRLKINSLADVCRVMNVCVCVKRKACWNDLTDESNALRYLPEWSQEIKVQVGEKQKRVGGERKKTLSQNLPLLKLFSCCCYLIWLSYTFSQLTHTHTQETLLKLLIASPLSAAASQCVCCLFASTNGFRD